MRLATALAMLMAGLAASVAAARPTATILVAARGRMLYLFTPDRNGFITCQTGYSNCPVIYHGHPRYVYAYEPGDLNGQGFINYWYVVSPAGKPVTKKSLLTATWPARDQHPTAASDTQFRPAPALEPRAAEPEEGSLDQ